MKNSDDDRMRRKRAMSVAAKIAADFGIESKAVRLLKDSNNTIFHLAPSPVVAKVATAPTERRIASNLRLELDVALHLARSGAPVVPPSPLIPPAVYRRDEYEATFWQYCPGKPREEFDEARLAATIEKFHRAFADYPNPLKPFTDDYEKCRALLDGDSLSPQLSADDRQFLRCVYDRLRARLQTFDYESVPVHTEIHHGNVLWTSGKPLLIDFESCRRGPKELDFLFLSEKSLSNRPNLDAELSETLSRLKSFNVAVWCWLQPERAPEVGEAARFHLNRLRKLTA